ncbi:hypothetical protein MKW98_023837 [Papaver atlanticum]|uniref:Uncharacterized protein n=1 Tax=Papaver atlanticum TaxID=357466 RepID=A0AAD4XNG1_9MAGN|nr:hypothetical protein MKW98_023837 [Papaver atlanticum]
MQGSSVYYSSQFGRHIGLRFFGFDSGVGGGDGNKVKNLLLDCAASHLKHKDVTASYGNRLASSSGRIRLQSPPGNKLYQERLVKALARELQVRLLVLDSSVLAPSSDASSDEGKQKILGAFIPFRPEEFVKVRKLKEKIRLKEPALWLKNRRIMLKSTRFLEEPNLLLLDEPTNHLDLDTIEWLEGYLSKQDVPMVMISHDRAFLDQLCTKIVETDMGVSRTFEENYSQCILAKGAWIEAQFASRSKLTTLRISYIGWVQELMWVVHQLQKRSWNRSRSLFNANK